MEVEVVYLTDSTGDNVTSVQNISYEFTDLRMDPDYIRLVDITVRRITHYDIVQYTTLDNCNHVISKSHSI